MINKKYIFIFTLPILFIFSNCCKKEVVKQESELTIESQVEQKQITSTIEQLSPSAYLKGMEATKVQLIDVRSQEEFNQGHIESSDNYNVLDSNFVDKVIKYKKDIPVYVYCTAGGKRSQDAAKILKEKGYNVVNLEGGLIEWTKKGYKVIQSN